MVRRALLCASFISVLFSGAGFAHAATKDGYPSPRAVAAQIKASINQQIAGTHYKWRYSRVTCQPEGATPGLLRCFAVGRWAFGSGSVMTTHDWAVTTTVNGDWTAKSVWTFSGHVDT
jgi:hypothetical protein